MLPRQDTEAKPGCYIVVRGTSSPQNILWFPDANPDSGGRGTLKISDFGTAEFALEDAVP